MKVFVAGATGAIGKQLVPRLVAAGHEVHGMTRSASKQPMLRELGAVPVIADALDADQVCEAVAAAAPDAIVHQLTAIGAVDIALWDIAGKIANLPIHRLIGTCRDSIGAYASSEIHNSIEAYAEQAQHYKATGWKAYKIHPPQRWRDDIKVCEAVRKAVAHGLAFATARKGERAAQ